LPNASLREEGPSVKRGFRLDWFIPAGILDDEDQDDDEDDLVLTSKLLYSAGIR
jgi:hypothetical protein